MNTNLQKNANMLPKKSVNLRKLRKMKKSVLKFQPKKLTKFVKKNFEWSVKLWRNLIGELNAILHPQTHPLLQRRHPHLSQ